MYQIIDNCKENIRSGQSSKHMNLDRISLVSFLLYLVQFCSLEGNAHTRKRPFITPCFEEEENLSKCSSLEDSCENASGFKLVRLEGVRVSGRLEYYSFN